jgi:HJR/Mrr/RecB family endonuclease
MTEGNVDFVVDKGMFAKTINVPLKPFVLLATAQSPAACSRQLLECFHLTITLVQQYSYAELALICQRIAQRKGILVTPDVAALIAKSSRGAPHDLELVISKLSSLGKAAIALEDVTAIMAFLGLSVSAASGGSHFTKMAELSGVEFEHAIAGLLERMGFCAQTTKATGDGGIDITATLGRPITGGKYLFQCKRFASDNLVGAATVREFYGAVTADQEAVKGILVTTSSFTAQAREFARHLRIELVDGEQLARLWAEQTQ